MAKFMHKKLYTQTGIFETDSQRIYNLRDNDFKLHLPKPKTEKYEFCRAKLFTPK